CGSEDPLPPPDVAPAAHLPADFAVSADGQEPGTFVQPDAGRVGEGNTGKGGMKTERLEFGQQRSVKPAADPLASPPRSDIDRDVARTRVGRPLAMRGCVGISRDPALAFGDEPAVGRTVAPDAAGHFLRVRRFQ